MRLHGGVWAQVEEERERRLPPQLLDLRAVSAGKEIAPHIAAIVGGEEGQRRADAFRIAETGASVLQVELLALSASAASRICRKFQFGFDAAGTDDVDADALAGKVIFQRHSHAIDGALAGAVGD